MKIVYDDKKRPWEILIDAPNYRRIKDVCGFDLTLIRFPRHDGGINLALSVEMVESGLLIMDICWAICTPQAHERNVDRDEFDVIVAGNMVAFRNAVIAETVDFFRLLRMKPEAEFLETLARLTPKEKDAILRQMQNEMGKKTASPEAPGPTPTPSSSSTPESPELEPISAG